MDDGVGPGGLQHVLHRAHVSKVSLHQVDFRSQMVDVLGLAPPPVGAIHLDSLLQGILSKMAAHEPGDPGQDDGCDRDLNNLANCEWYRLRMGGDSLSPTLARWFYSDLLPDAAALRLARGHKQRYGRQSSPQTRVLAITVRIVWRYTCFTR